MVFLNPFDGARTKLERARELLVELSRLESTFVGENPLTLEFERQDSGDTVVFAVIKALPPPRLSAVVGDILGAMRASLDIGVCQACIARGQTDQKLVEKSSFLFAGNERDWDNQVKGRMQGADQEIRSLVKSFKPWRDGGNGHLYSLSKLAAKDKHLDLVPIGLRPRELTIDQIAVTRDDGLGVGIQAVMPQWGRVEKVELLRVLAPGRVESIGSGRLSARLGFALSAPAMGGQPVVTTLHNIGHFCVKAVDALEELSRK